VCIKGQAYIACPFFIATHRGTRCAGTRTTEIKHMGCKERQSVDAVGGQFNNHVVDKLELVWYKKKSNEKRKV